MYNGIFGAADERIRNQTSTNQDSNFTDAGELQQVVELESSDDSESSEGSDGGDGDAPIPVVLEITQVDYHGARTGTRFKSMDAWCTDAQGQWEKSKESKSFALAVISST